MPCFSIIWILVTLAHKKKASCKYTPNRGWKTIFSYWESNFLGAMLYFPNYNISPDQISLKFSGISRNLSYLIWGPKLVVFSVNSHLLSTWGLPLLVPTAITLVISDEDRHHSQGQEKKVHSQLLGIHMSHEKKTFLLSIRLVVW